MSNPLTTKTHEAVWDERHDLDSAMAVLYEINVQHEINRICITRKPDFTRLAAMHVLKARYRAMIMAGSESISSPAVNFVRHYENIGFAAFEQASRRGTVPMNFSLENEQNRDNNNNSVAIVDSNELSETRDGVPRCFNHPHNRRATYHHASECRVLDQQHRASANEEPRRQQQEPRGARQHVPSSNNDRIGALNHNLNPSNDFALFEDRRFGGIGTRARREQDDRRHSRSLSPGSSRRYK